MTRILVYKWCQDVSIRYLIHNMLVDISIDEERGIKIDLSQPDVVWLTLFSSPLKCRNHWETLDGSFAEPKENQSKPWRVDTDCFNLWKNDFDSQPRSFPLEIG